MEQAPGSSSNSTIICQNKNDLLCPFTASYEYNKAYTNQCICAAPIRVGYRLKSPGFSDFRPYKSDFVKYLTSGLELNIRQLYIDSFMWEEGPRLRMYLKFFPNNSSIFNTSEILEIRTILTRWKIPDNDVFGPYEVLNFTLLGPYKDVIMKKKNSSSNKGVMFGIIFGVIATIVTCTAIIWVLILKRKIRYQKMVSKRRKLSRIQIKIDDVKDFTFRELSQATRKFSESSQVGQGGYGRVYKGILADGTEVAIKRAQEASLQGSKEFFTEIELLSKLHHRNLVSLIGYCDEDEEQMLVYEFMPNGTLRDHLSAKSNKPLSYFMRLRIALDSAKGILYLHTEVVPPIFHRDIKASNILLDSKFTAKVADFGLSRVVPEFDPDASGTGHVSTVVKGTPGYLDPEYFLNHKLTDKSDVYSLGIVFLELLTGMLPISHGRNIVREVNLGCRSGGALSVIDKRMEHYPPVCVERFLALALRCCEDDSDARPSMLEVVRELESIRLMYPDAHITSSDSIATGGSTEANTIQSSIASGGVYLDSNAIASNLTNHDMPSRINPR